MICSLQSQYKEFYRLLNSVKCTAELIYWYKAKLCSNTHTHPFDGPFSRTTRVGRYQKGKTNLDFTEARQ